MNERGKNTQTDSGNQLTLWNILRILLSRFYLLLIAGVVVAAAVYLVLRLFVTPVYESRVSFYVYNSSDSTAYSGTINNNELQAAESLAITYSKIVASNSVLDAVLEDLGTNEITRKELSKMVSVSVITDTQLLEVVVSSTDREFACQIANSFAKVAPTEIVRITKAGGVEVVDQPEVATDKSSPRTLFDTAVGFLVGMILMAIVLILKTMSDTTLYLPEDIEERCGATILGQIPEIPLPEGNFTPWNVVKGGVVRLEER